MSSFYLDLDTQFFAAKNMLLTILFRVKYLPEASVHIMCVLIETFQFTIYSVPYNLKYTIDTVQFTV